MKRTMLYQKIISTVLERHYYHSDGVIAIAICQTPPLRLGNFDNHTAAFNFFILTFWRTNGNFAIYITVSRTISIADQT